jgi:hypothetical protein
MKLFDPMQGIKLWLLNPFLHLAMACGWGMIHIMDIPREHGVFTQYDETMRQISKVFFIEHCILFGVLSLY